MKRYEEEKRLGTNYADTLSYYLFNFDSISGYEAAKKFLLAVAVLYVVVYCLLFLKPAKKDFVTELTSDQIFQETCGNKTCAIGFLPGWWDCDDECRKTFFDQLKINGRRFMQYDWLWLKFGSQPQLENVLFGSKLNHGSRNPALVR